MDIVSSVLLSNFIVLHQNELNTMDLFNWKTQAQNDISMETNVLILTKLCKELYDSCAFFLTLFFVYESVKIY